MGKIKQGILGGFNGTTGSVVGASWKGIAYMRGKAQSIKNPRTDSQQLNRTLFGQVSDFMSRSKSCVDVGFKYVSQKKSPFNSAVQSNMKIFTNAGGSFDYEQLVFSKGGLTPLLSGLLSKSERTLTASFSLYDNPPHDLQICVLFVVVGEFAASPLTQFTKVVISPNNISGTANFLIPSSIDYSDCYAYAFVQDTFINEVSSTTYLGHVTNE